MSFDDPILAEARTSTSRSWSALSADDQRFYTALREQFLNKRPAEKGENPLLFRSEIQTVIEFIDHSQTGREQRSIVAGLGVAGPFIVVNTRQLKHLIRRCKSSINGSFQHLGYLAVKTKSKARECVLGILPTLKTDQGAIRQWTVRFSKSNSGTIPALLHVQEAPAPARTAEDPAPPPAKEEADAELAQEQPEPPDPDADPFVWISHPPAPAKSGFDIDSWATDDLQW
jgi:hypothetical protein